MCDRVFIDPAHPLPPRQISTSMSGVLMGIPSITYIIAAPIGGWLGEVWGYRPILFIGTCPCFFMCVYSPILDR